jgi:hypothetical protein
MFFDADDIILLDGDDGMVEAVATSGGIWGFQVNADVTGYNDYTVSHPGYSAKKYRHVDTMNKAGSPPTITRIDPASAWKQLFQLPDISDASPTIYSVRLDAYPFDVDTVAHQFLAGVSDEGTGPETITPWDDGVSGYITHLMHTTPKDGNAWTKGRFGDLYFGLYRTSSKRIREVGVQVFGKSITAPSANPDSDNADVADPWAVVSRRRWHGGHF